MNAPRTVLVTGATGLVGQHLTRRLLDRPELRVRILARDPHALHALLGPDAARLDIHTGDLTRPDTLHTPCQNVHTLYHCAIATLPTFDAGRHTRPFDAVNHLGTRHLAHAALDAHVHRFVHVSSTAAMGTPHAPSVDESTPCNPTTPYQHSKRDAELALLDLHRLHGLPVVIARPCLVAGPGKRGGELLQLFELCRDGRFPLIGRAAHARKPLIDVSDLVQALPLLADKGRTGQIYLLHSGQEHTLGDILAAAARLTRRRRVAIPIPRLAALIAAHLTTPLARLARRTPPLTPQRLELFLTDRHIRIDKARRELGFDPQTNNLDLMLGHTYDWYRDSGQI